MKRLSRILTAALVAALLSYASVVTYIEESKPVLPPERLQNIFFVDGGSRNMPLDLDAVVREADAIAHVRVGDWLGDEPQTTNTCFEVFPIEVYKGELPERFFILQSGHVDKRYETWYTYGNELFLFLTKAEDTEHGSYRFDDTYYSTDGNHTSAIVAYATDGTRYAIPRIYDPYVMYGKSGLSQARGLSIYDELHEYLVASDPLLWEENEVERAYSLDQLVERIDEILAASSTEPPEVSLSIDSEVVPLEPREFSWSSPSGEYESPDATHPLLLSDDEWNALPYFNIGAEKFEVLCPVEPQYVNIQAWHESYRGTDDPWNTNLVERRYIIDEDGVFETRAHGGYVYVVTVGWDSDPVSGTPQFKGYADFAFRVGESAEVDAEQITLASFDEYPTEQLSNLLADTPRDEMRGRFGEPDISSEYNDLWLTDSGKFVRAQYHPGDDSVFYIRSLLGLPSTPPILVTIDGVSYPVVTGNASWMYSVDGVVESGLQACHADLQNRDWSADTIYTDAREAVITLDLPERIAERIDITIDGAEITADGAGEAFPLYYGGFTYMFTALISEKCGEGEEPLFGGKVDCAFRAVVGSE